MRKTLVHRTVFLLRNWTIALSPGLSRPLSSSIGNDVSVLDNYTIEGGEDTGSSTFRLKAAGKALETYINEGNNYAKMMAKEREQFDLGKRHLANIMGLDVNNITQEDIDRAIEYLFPSGLTDKKALPVLKPPEEILPKFQKLDFNEEGRPRDFLFYSLSPKFHRILSEVGNKTMKLTQEYFTRSTSEKTKEQTQELSLASSGWLDLEDLVKKVEERITEEMYAHLILALEYLISLPLAWKEKDFIMGFRKPLTGSTENVLFGPGIPQVEVDPETQRRFARVKTTVKRSTAYTTVIDRGSGKYSVNGLTLDSFRILLTREIFFAPLIVTDLLGKIDIISNVEGPGGSTVIPRVVRHGVALGIAALFPNHFEKLRLAGLLTRDPRRKERNKVNQPGARAKWIWKRR